MHEQQPDKPNGWLTWITLVDQYLPPLLQQTVAFRFSVLAFNFIRQSHNQLITSLHPIGCILKATCGANKIFLNRHSHRYVPYKI